MDRDTNHVALIKSESPNGVAVIISSVVHPFNAKDDTDALAIARAEVLRYARIFPSANIRLEKIWRVSGEVPLV